MFTRHIVLFDSEQSKKCGLINRGAFRGWGHWDMSLPPGAEGALLTPAGSLDGASREPAGGGVRGPPRLATWMEELFSGYGALKKGQEK